MKYCDMELETDLKSELKSDSDVNQKPSIRARQQSSMWRCSGTHLTTRPTSTQNGAFSISGIFVMKQRSTL